MAEVWDTIIVGSGIGGLTAAAHLVKAGLRVLVLERNPHIGGTAFVYRRKGFIFPMGPLGFSYPKLIQETLKDLGVGENLKLSRVHYRIRAFDLDIPLSLPFHEMVKELTRIFPSDAKGLEEFFNDMMVMNPSNHLSTKKSPYISASEYLSRFIKDWRLRRILGSIGTREPYSGLPLLAAMWNLMCKEGIWYPIEGMESFCDRLVKAIMNPQDSGQAKGVGEIRLRTEVIKIRIENGKVLGVILKDGTQLDSPSVISNADYKRAFLKLMEPKTIPPEWYNAISSARQTGSIFQVCLGVDSDKADLSAFKRASRLIIYRRDGTNVQEGENLDWNVQEIDPKALASQELEVSLWGKDWGMQSSEGKAVIVIRAEADYNHFAKYRSGWRQRSPEYQGYKIRLAHTIIQEVEKLISELSNAILVMDVATPLTFEDQGGRSEGAVAGWSWDYEDFRDDQPKELILTPIRGLYMAGYQAFSALFMGGAPTAMESGKRAANAVLDGAGPIEEIMIPRLK